MASPRYSGPALAAGAISKAIGDLFEGILAGQRGGLEAERKIGELGMAEREMGLKTAAFPFEAALSRAQAQLAGAETTKRVAETERLYALTPEERAQLRAETQRAGAQADVYGEQAFGMGMERRLQQQAIGDWEQARAAAQAKGRALTYEDILSWARRHPVLLAGAQKIPSAALMDLNTLELWLKQLQAQHARSPYEGPKFLLDVQQQAHREAGDIVKQAFGEQAGPEAADTQAWLAGASRNRILVETLGPDSKQAVSSPGPAPRQLVDYVFNQLRKEHPQEEHVTLRAWTYEIISLLGMGAVSWQAAFESLRQLNQPQPTQKAPSAPAPATAPAAPAGPSYRYNPASGEFGEFR